MARTRTLGWILALALGSGASARGDEPPPPQGPPSDAPGPQVVPTGPVDLLEYLGRVKVLFQQHEVPPPKTASDHALFDAWTSILKPRAARMTARVRNLMERGRWEMDRTGLRALHLRSAAWNGTIGELAALYAEVGGALEQYLKVRYTVTQVRPTDLHYPYPTYLYAAYGLGALESGFLHKLRHGHPILADEIATYWYLLNRVDYAMALHAERLRQYEERKAEIEEELQNLVANIEGGLEGKRQTLALQMLSVRMLTASLQAREEARLTVLVSGLPEESPARAQLDGLLIALRAKRIEAETHVEPPVSQYGTLLRRWLKLHQDALAVLRKAGVDPATPVNVEGMAAGTPLVEAEVPAVPSPPVGAPQ